MTEQLYSVSGKATFTSGLLLESSEVLRSLRHYCRHKVKDITPSMHGGEKHAWIKASSRLSPPLRRPMVWRPWPCNVPAGGAARRPSLEGRERAIVNQTNFASVSKATLGKLLRDGVERIIMGISKLIDTVFNWTVTHTVLMPCFKLYI